MKRALHRAILLAALLAALAAPVVGQNEREFDAFYASFKQAVAQKDEAALREMMAPRFAFIRGTNVAPDIVFQGLAADNGRQWLNLQQAVQGQPIVYRGKQGRLFRVLPCTPTDVIYNCAVVFLQDAEGRWRWKGMIMPTR
ncbi:MAG TPA: hypothetical protein VNK82_05765 [Terriglobales bacterium]|nr:hypothetical protein [Terriglobales bacterium]